MYRNFNPVTFNPFLVAPNFKVINRREEKNTIEAQNPQSYGVILSYWTTTSNSYADESLLLSLTPYLRLFWLLHNWEERQHAYLGLMGSICVRFLPVGGPF